MRPAPTLSSNTQATLLLTAPLLTGNGREGAAPSDRLTPGEYKRLVRELQQMEMQPGDLLEPGSEDRLSAAQPVGEPITKPTFEKERLQRLLARGFLLSQAVERWQTRGLWVLSRADALYPTRLKTLLCEDAPALLFGCGDISLCETGGLAVVGSRDVDESLIEYTRAVGGLAAKAGKTLVSGGARGIDQAAMRGAIEEGGSVVGVLADSLEKTALNREHRDLIQDRQLVLVSPYDPGAGFNVGNAMQRNKLIYALADAALVVSSDYEKGGTWAGAVEQLRKFKFVPVYVRSTGDRGKGLEALEQKGAVPWSNPTDGKSLAAVLAERPAAQPEPSVADWGMAREWLRGILVPATKTKMAADLALHLHVSSAQAKKWVQQAVAEGVLQKGGKPVGYAASRQQTNLFQELR